MVLEFQGFRALAFRFWGLEGFRPLVPQDTDVQTYQDFVSVMMCAILLVG